jgi:2-polyprenyl-3-methyl-5-hydroxy-6-metoxy-1,4-benzoquinol methylase
MISHDDVRAAYRLLLGREPESEQIVEEQARVESLEILRQQFLHSEEFRAKFESSLRVGRYLDVARSEIEVDSTPEQLARMLDRISREWIGFGERDPHWSVLVNDDFIMPNIAAHEDEFYRTGEPDIAVAMAMIRRNRGTKHFRQALDFGCGVGRLTLALAPHVDAILGIDISPPHLVWARDRAAKTGIVNARFESIARVEDLARRPGQDLILSLIVLQHNPPPVMAALLRALLDLLNPGGLALFQLPTYLDGVSFSIDAYFGNWQPPMEMNALPQNVVFDVIHQAGCVPLEVREDGRIGATPGLSHTFLVEKRG